MSPDVRHYISMLRGINVSGQKKIRMAELQKLYEDLGLREVQTYVQSGNVVFAGTENRAAVLAQTIEKEIGDRFGYEVTVFIRSAGDFRRITGENPFLNGRSEDISRLYVTFLYQPPESQKLEGLVVPAGGADEFAGGEQEIFLFCPGGYGRTRLSNTFFEKKLGMPATTRNWKTVTALWEMIRERES